MSTSASSYKHPRKEGAGESPTPVRVVSALTQAEKLANSLLGVPKQVNPLKRGKKIR